MKRGVVASENIQMFVKYRRPRKKMDGGSLCVQQTDIDWYLGYPRNEIIGHCGERGLEYKTFNERVLVFRIFGSTRDGHSVVGHIHGFRPYFYILLEPESCIDGKEIQQVLEVCFLFVFFFVCFFFTFFCVTGAT